MLNLLSHASAVVVANGVCSLTSCLVTCTIYSDIDTCPKNVATHHHFLLSPRLKEGGWSREVADEIVQLCWQASHLGGVRQMCIEWLVHTRSVQASSGYLETNCFLSIQQIQLSLNIEVKGKFPAIGCPNKVWPGSCFYPWMLLRLAVVQMLELQSRHIYSGWKHWLSSPVKSHHNCCRSKTCPGAPLPNIQCKTFQKTFSVSEHLIN